MKNRMLFILALGLLTLMPELMAQTAEHYFFQMPAKLIPTVPLETRKDLVDFYKNGKTAVMPTAMGGEVVLKDLSEDYLLLKTSESGDIQLKLLQVNDTLHILALVHTVAAPMKDSRIVFYSTTWEPLNNIALPVISYLDFLDKEKGKALGLENRYNEVCMRVFLSYKFNKNSPLLVAYSSLKEDLRSEIKKDFEPIIRDSLVFEWQNGHFARRNSKE
jgi:hypothetical protein